MRCLLSMLILPALMCFGCSAPEAELPEFLTSTKSNILSPAWPERHFDFGTILASGQTLEHRFRIENPTEKPLRLLKAESFTPCCSAVGPLPAPIPPNGSGEVVVQFRVGFATGLKRVEFTVQTDREASPVISLSISAKMTSALEVDPSEPGGIELVCGKPGTRKLTVTCRRKEKEGLDAPTALQIAAPLKARFIGPISEVNQGGIIESRRHIEIEFPATKEPGTKSTELVILWQQAGRDDRRSIVWTVTPVLKPWPPAIILEAGGHGSLMREVVVESTGAEFKILAVKGKALGLGFQLPGEKLRSHRLIIPIDPTNPGISDLTIKTDHPDQIFAIISVMINSDPKAIRSSGAR